jgi:hypothetical protein
MNKTKGIEKLPVALVKAPFVAFWTDHDQRYQGLITATSNANETAVSCKPNRSEQLKIEAVKKPEP